MSRPALAGPLAAALAVALTACSSLRPEPAQGAEGRLTAALEALADGDFVTAHGNLLALHAANAHSALGRRAALALAAVQLDPDNPNRDPADGIGWLRRYLDAEPADELASPVRHALFHLAAELETGDETGPAAGDERIALLEEERAALVQRIETLERELERIRRILRP